jgi:dethiobiotin synthetase
MTQRFIVSATDTGVGKTTFSAALAGALGATYWKPVQSGLDEETDTQAVQRLSGLPTEKILPEAYRLKTPASPHLSAEIDATAIDPESLILPAVSGPFVVEGAGGLLTPLTRDTLYIDLFARWGLPLILCTRTTLGTINHTLLSVEALRHRQIALHGIVFIGDEHADNERTICEFARARHLGRLPHLPHIDAAALRAAFNAAFRLEDFNG